MPFQERQIHAEIEIDAPPAQVWDVLTGFDRYARWNPFLVEARGRADVGQALALRAALPGYTDRTFYPRIVEVRPQRELTWAGRLVFPGLVDGTHSFFLEPLDDGQRTLLIQHENFSGLLIPLVPREIEAATRRGFVDMNLALKNVAEHVFAPL